MIRGLYASATGMAAETVRQDVVANNLANAATTGFQRQLAAFNSLSPTGGTSPAGPVPLEPGVRVNSVVTDRAPGTLVASGNPLDVAISGRGYFVVRTPAGLLYTRDGSFRLGEGGRLETQQGYPVLGRGGEIQIGNGPVTIGTDGSVNVAGRALDHLQVVDIPAASMRRAPGGEVLPSDDAQPVANPQVLSGYHEGSNVNPVREMTAMIAGFRVYEANQRAIQMQDRTLEQAANEVARV
ncbi:MAG TPA: flagellar hook-basal body protein [Armatimonadota bacterium]|nr:flagellar hook-basal body protein [Armatimonadota bacterium]